MYLEGSDGGNGWDGVGTLTPAASNLKDKVRKILFSILFFSTHIRSISHIVVIIGHLSLRLNS